MQILYKFKTKALFVVLCTRYSMFYRNKVLTPILPQHVRGREAQTDHPILPGLRREGRWREDPPPRHPALRGRTPYHRAQD